MVDMCIVQYSSLGQVMIDIWTKERALRRRGNQLLCCNIVISAPVCGFVNIGRRTFRNKELVKLLMVAPTVATRMPVVSICNDTGKLTAWHQRESAQASYRAHNNRHTEWRISNRTGKAKEGSIGSGCCPLSARDPSKGPPIRPSQAWRR